MAAISASENDVIVCNGENMAIKIWGYYLTFKDFKFDFFFQFVCTLLWLTDILILLILL